MSELNKTLLTNHEQSRGNTRTVLVLATLAALWFFLCRHLSSEWSVNEQYNYGWFVPFFAAYLFWLRWEQRPEIRDQKSEVRGERALVISSAILALSVLFPVRLFEVANPDWRPLGWIHALVVITITFAVIYLAVGWAWVKHFSFPILFFLVAVPWVTPIEEPIVQGLMRGIASIASEVLNLFGIPTQLHGNIVRISNGSVGVNEACSGVRSLQTSLLIALLFGELNRLPPWRRVLLVFAALGLALAANTIRAFILVWLAATQGMSVMEKSHDIAGYLILAIVFVGSWALAHWLKREGATGNSKVKMQTPAAESPFLLSPFYSPLRLSTFHFLLPIAFVVVTELGVETWYRIHEHDLRPAAQWTVEWPEQKRGYRTLEIDDRIRGILRCNTGGGAVWQINSNSGGTPNASSGGALNSLLYFFRWEPGRSSVLRARAHRPDICLPSAGWKQTADDGVRTYPTDAGIDLPFRHFEFAQDDQVGGRIGFAHTFFCIWQDRVASRAGNATEVESKTPGGWAVIDRWHAVANGQRELGQQVLELVLTSAVRIDFGEAERIFTDQIRGAIKPSSVL